MSEISRLARAFEKRSTEQAESTEKAVQSAFKEHESALMSALSESEKTTNDAIRAQSQRLQKTALKSWMAVTIPVVLTLLLAVATMATMGWYMSRQVEQIARHKETLETLEAEGSAIELSQCGGRLCAKIAEPDSPGYGDNGQYRILKGY